MRQQQPTIETDGYAIQSLRYARGLSTPDLKRLSGVHDSTIRRIESGERQGSAAVLKKIADALGVTVADITRPARRTAKPATTAAA